MININNILPKDNELTDFEKMIMKWTAFDHFCPSIKAEVIWDMMLSEFVVDMVSYTYRKKYGEQYTADNFYLLAKEFPIKSEEDDDTKQKDSLSCSKVDYLVAFEADKTSEDDNKKVILVELKTTPGSFSPKQLERYKNCDVKKLFDFYDKLISKKVKLNQFAKDPLKWEGSEKYTGQITYMFHQFRQFHGETGTMKDFPSSFIKTMQNMYKGMELFYLYVERVKTKGSEGTKDAYNLSVQMEVKKLEGNDAQVGKYMIYDSNHKNLPDDFLEFITGKYGKDSSKVKSWKTFCKLIDAVNNYKTDFEEKKQKYEPYHRD